MRGNDATQAPESDGRTFRSRNAGAWSRSADRDDRLPRCARDRVAQCSLAIAVQLGVDADVRTAVVKGALLHDVGKLRVDEQILSKPGPLTAKSDARSESILGGRADHRRGSRARGRGGRPGAPRALGRQRLPARARGDQIPLAARVVAVADAYLAMCEDRPYRKRRTTTDAVRELKECAGTQFDPRCVDALVAVIDVRD